MGRRGSYRPKAILPKRPRKEEEVRKENEREFIRGGVDKVRPYYYEQNYSHPNRRRKKKKELGNYPALRTFIGNIDLSVTEMCFELMFYIERSGIKLILKRHSDLPYTLEEITRSLDCYVSNYTISGLLNTKWGPRHNPLPSTTENIRTLIQWLKSVSKKIGTYKPFRFKLSKSHKASYEEIIQEIQRQRVLEVTEEQRETIEEEVNPLFIDASRSPLP